MAIRIDRIKVNRGGPLRGDFEFEPGDMNLIYGHNETGKTYIVETLINLLFRTGSKSPAKWNLREWDLTGRIIVSGLEEESVAFTKTDKKLEQYWEEGSGLPRDLSRLLVVKAGETELDRDGKDGVGRSILKDYLSGEGLLDNIAYRISSTLKEAKVQDRLIVGAKMGELKTRKKYEKSLLSINILLKEVEEGYTSGEGYFIRQKKEGIEAELGTLEEAKRYHAAQLHTQIQTLSQQRDGQPTEEELSSLEADVAIYDAKKAEAETKSVEYSQREASSENYRWAKIARDEYSDIISKHGASGQSPILILFALLFFVGAVITGFMGLKVPFAVCVIGTLVFSIIHYLKTWNASARAGESTELERLKLDFKRRFGSKLTNRVVLDVILEKLKEDHILANSLREEMNKLTLEINSFEIGITKTLKSFTGDEQPPLQTRESIRTLRSGIKRLENVISSRERMLDLLAVKEKEYLAKDPGVGWDAERYDSVNQELVEIDADLDEELGRLEHLKVRIKQETDSQSTEWEILINELREKREQIADEYRDITAQILAKVQVNIAIEDFREKEDARIADGLKGDELTRPLQALTAGRYNKIKQEKESGLILVTVEDEEFPLAGTSTGAREQIFLALRIGFASIVMEGQAAFLILDDAFQHSDWDRRKKMIDYTLNLVENGWQIFYFAMDDHIRDKFLEVGGTLGNRFKSLELR